MGDKLETMNPPENQQNSGGVSFDQQHSQTLGFKRPRYGVGPGLFQRYSFKRPRYGIGPDLLQQHIAVGVDAMENYNQSRPFPTLAAKAHITARSSSSSNASCPSHSSQGLGSSHQLVQIKKGKVMSPISKPDEMLCLARAWRAQYEGSAAATATFRHLKSRKQMDQEVVEFLKVNGFNRDAKTAGRKWNDMLRQFRKLYDWERRGDVGKSYFRLSSYERNMQKLPASFDEGVYNELSFFLGHSTGTTAAPTALSRLTQGSDSVSTQGSAIETVKSLLPPPSKDDCSGRRDGKSMGMETLDVKLRRVGEMTMAWEESVTLWAENEVGTGRVNVESLIFLNVDILKFLDDSRGMTITNLEAFEDGPLKGFSVRRFTSGQCVKVFGRRDGRSMGMESSNGKLHPVGEVTMTWGQILYLWAEEEDGSGRVKMESLRFLKARNLIVLEDSTAITMLAYANGPLKGFSVNRFASGEHVHVFG